MTSQLKAEFEAIDLQNVIKPMFNQLDEVIEYAIENMDEEVSSLDIIDYITDCMQSYLEDRRGLNEGFSTEPENDEIWDHLEGLSDYNTVNNYMKSGVLDNPDIHGWTLADWEEDFNKYNINKAEYMGEDYISEEELMKEHFKRHAGL